MARIKGPRVGKTLRSRGGITSKGNPDGFILEMNCSNKERQAQSGQQKPNRMLRWMDEMRALVLTTFSKKVKTFVTN